MVASRWTSHPTIVPDCPVCGRELPPVTVDVDARSDGRVLVLLEANVCMDPPWWDAAAAAHPDCGVRMAQQQYLAGLS
jgi:hypothetical protein